LRNRDAARYAGWAAGAAALVALVVAGVYATRLLRQARERRAEPKAVPASVQRQSADFSYSDVEQGRTVFKVRASQFTEYKDQDRALLEDVWITVYGRDGSRNDNIHTRECSFEPASGLVRCQGQVKIDVQDAKTAAGQRPADILELTTSNLSFNKDTGEASTPAPVEFHFAAGQGRGVGAFYSSHDAVMRIEQQVGLELAPSARTSNLPVTATGARLEIRRNDHLVVLDGPAVVREGDRELSSDKISAKLDQSYHARLLVAEGHPEIRADANGGKIEVSATRFAGVLDPTGWIEQVAAEGDVLATRHSQTATDRFAAARVTFAMVPGRNLIREMTANGVTTESRHGSDSRRLKTEAIRLTFSRASTAERNSAAGAGSTKGTESTSIEQQRIESAETLAPATIESKTGGDATTLQGKKFVAEMGSDGRLKKLLGHSGVEIRKQSGSGAAQTISATEMVATFDAKGEWETLDESGNVEFQQADRHASAARARLVQASDTIYLDGSPVLWDSVSRTTAGRVVVNSKSGELQGSGGIVSTYLPSLQESAMSLGAGAAHVSAETLSGSVNSGHVTYSGHARLWQGGAVLDTDQIDVWREDQKLQATGHVVAVFPQASGPLANPFGQLAAVSAKPGGRVGSQTESASPTGPTLWTIRAPMLTYWGTQGRAHLEGGVLASSQQGSLASKTLELFLEPARGPSASAGSASAGRAPKADDQVSAGRELNRVLAEGDVVVRQGGRHGTGERAEYTAADGKFVLSGGEPTVTDGSSNTATGHSLTFFVANDTILIDSNEGSRTLTKHRVEK
jgi:lipopolysaccharide export system protein LptA